MAKLSPARLTSHPFAARPVPRQGRDALARAAGAAFDGSDPRGREPLVEARSLGLFGENYYAIRDGRNPPYGRPIAGATEALLLRQGVARALARVDQALAAHGLALWLHDGWRPLAVQRGLWEACADAVGRANPGWSAAEVAGAVGALIADPRGFDPDAPGTWPPHLTGGAVDLALCWRGSGERLDFGAGFDEAGAPSETDFFERALAAGDIVASDERLIARRILTHAMAAEGFTNYPLEYWHFDLGTRLWAALTGQSAFYPPVLAHEGAPA